MFSLQQNVSTRRLSIEPSSCGYGGRKHDRAGGRIIIRRRNDKTKRKVLETERGLGLQYYCSCSSSSSSSTSSSAAAADHHEQEVGRKGSSMMFGYLVKKSSSSSSGHRYRWNVRRMVEEKEEMRKVAHVQAQAFHQPVFLFNHLFFQFFQAEVLSGLLYRLRNSAPDRYACLVAEPNFDASESHKELVGVVDVTVSRDEAVLQHLPGVEEYLYVSGIAVLHNFRRQKVATALLKACDQLSDIWGFRYLVLRAYEDDWGARKLYTYAGYRVVSGDPPWMTTWIGRKRRVLMIKHSNSCD